MKAPPAPTAPYLHESALAYLANRPASVAQMKRVLARRTSTWARRASRAGADEAEIASGAERSREAAETVLARLKESGLLDDAAFAKQRASSLTRAGKSRRAVAFDLTRKGVADAITREASARDADAEFAAAVIFTRKKRLGAFAKDSDAPKEERERERRRWLGALARAGYAFSTADRVLRLDRESAEEILRATHPIGW